MHVLDLNSFFSELGGGVRTYTRQKMRFFRNHPEHRYTLVVGGPENRVDDEDGVRVYRVRGFLLSRTNRYRQLWDVMEIGRILRIERPDVVEVGSPYLDPWLTQAALRGFGTGTFWPFHGIEALRMPRMKLVGFYHADFPDTYMAPFSANWPGFVRQPFMSFWRNYVRFTYGRFDATLSPSYWIHRKLTARGVPNAHAVPLGVDPQLFAPTRRDPVFRRALGVRPGEKLLLYAGRFFQEKGVETLCDALPAVLTRPDVKALFVGRGYLEPRVDELVARYPGRVQKLDFIQDPVELARVYASADAFLSPGPYETFGLATVEALASGLPVVAPSEGGSAETVSSSQAGVLFRAHDSAALARATLDLLDQDLGALGARARRFAESQMTWDDTFERMLGIYERLVSHAPHPRPVEPPRHHPRADAWDPRGNAVDFAESLATPGVADRAGLPWPVAAGRPSRPH